MRTKIYAAVQIILLFGLTQLADAKAPRPRRNPIEWKVNSPVGDLRKEIEYTPEKSGGIYYAYPVTADEDFDIPEGFEPVFLTHYGRHGSRWCLKEYQYPMADSVFAMNARIGNLTPLGNDVRKLLLRVSAHAAGHAGELSPLGERQHRGIAERMAARFPTLFSDSTRVEARSSEVQRCIMSMAAFCERLKEINPHLRVQRHCTPGDMDFIAYDSPESNEMARGDAPWRVAERIMRDSIIQPDRLMASLFINPQVAIDSLKSAMERMYAARRPGGDRRPPKDAPRPQGPSDSQMSRELMKLLHDIAVDIQDVDELNDVSLLDIFTPEERFNLWQMLNMNMYVRHANAEAGNQAGKHSARHMLKRILDIADEALATTERPDIPVKLHFGHDTHLIRLSALMGIEGCDRSESNASEFANAWQDFRVSPMGANLQFAFFRNKDGRTLLLIRHNEQNATLPIKFAAEGAPFYDWNDVRQLWQSKLN